MGSRSPIYPHGACTDKSAKVSNNDCCCEIKNSYLKKCVFFVLWFTQDHIINEMPSHIKGLLASKTEM